MKLPDSDVADIADGLEATISHHISIIVDEINFL